MHKFISVLFAVGFLVLSQARAGFPIYTNFDSKYITAVTFNVIDNNISGVYYQREYSQDQFSLYPFKGVIHINENNNFVFEVVFNGTNPPDLVGTSLNEVPWVVKNGTRLYIPFMKSTPNQLPMTIVKRVAEFQRTTF
jgi:hypothetical protein